MAGCGRAAASPAMWKMLDFHMLLSRLHHTPGSKLWVWHQPRTPCFSVPPQAPGGVFLPNEMWILGTL